MIKTNFANGLIYIPDEKQKPLVFDGTYVSIKNINPTIKLTASHGFRNYYLELSNISNAWRIENPNKKWLAIRLNNFSGHIEYVVLDKSPDNSFGSTFPINPEINDVFFHIILNKFFYWDGHKWINIVQVTIATIENGIINLKPVGTQVGINSIIISYKILYTIDNLKKSNVDEYYFLTEKDLQAQELNEKSLRFNNIIFYNTSSEYIPEFSLVSLDSNYKVVLADNSDYPCFAMCLENCQVGEIPKLIFHGEVYNKHWNFSDDEIGKNIFLSMNGTFSLILDSDSIIQKIGTVVSKNVINLMISEPIYLLTANSLNN